MASTNCLEEYKRGQIWRRFLFGIVTPGKIIEIKFHHSSLVIAPVRSRGHTHTIHGCTIDRPPTPPLLCYCYYCAVATTPSRDRDNRIEMASLLSASRHAAAARSVISSSESIAVVSAATGSAAAAGLRRRVSPSISSGLPRGICSRAISVPRQGKRQHREVLPDASGGRLLGFSKVLAKHSAGGCSGVAAGGISRRSSSSKSADGDDGGDGSDRPALKPMRSVLYTPGSSRHLYKVKSIACDASLIDLEVRDYWSLCLFRPSVKYVQSPSAQITSVSFRTLTALSYQYSTLYYSYNRLMSVSCDVLFVFLCTARVLPAVRCAAQLKHQSVTNKQSVSSFKSCYCHAFVVRKLCYRVQRVITRESTSSAQCST